MGIKGLKTFLKSYQPQPENIPKNSTLLVDGPGFLFSILATIDIQQSLRSENFYLRLHETIVAEINRLQFMEFNLKFYFDGKETRFKSQTKEKRRQEIRKKWKKLYAVVTKQIKADVPQDELPIPTLCMEQLILTLLSLRVPVRLCPGECDQEMAIDCANSDRPTYCYTGDRYSSMKFSCDFW